MVKENLTDDRSCVHTNTALYTTFFICVGLSFSPTPGRFSTCHDMISSAINVCIKKPWCRQGVQPWTRRRRSGRERKSRGQCRVLPSPESAPGPVNVSSKGQSGFASNLIGCDAGGKLHWKLLSSKCEGEGLGLGDADDTREEDGGAPIVGVNRPQFEDMWLEEIKAQWNDACLDSHPWSNLSWVRMQNAVRICMSCWTRWRRARPNTSVEWRAKWSLSGRSPQTWPTWGGSCLCVGFVLWQTHCSADCSRQVQLAVEQQQLKRGGRRRQISQQSGEGVCLEKKFQIFFENKNF